ncbi:SufB/SufD family protein [Phaeovulum sp. W22_SRMD_FR3]|uniref:SufB/SufD family protein n=1 Tax=Phaeovulum sp. W22_SRMD_FR3 TaxID=3240274 RepID=UPI003F9DD748
MAGAVKPAEVKAAALAARLTGLSLPEGGFTAPARAQAMARLQAMGLPGKRDEYWRYTDPSLLTAPAATAASPHDTQDEAPLFAEIAALRLVFNDGVFDAEASDALAGSGVELLSSVQALDLHWAQGLYGVLEASGQKPVDRPLAALNTAVAQEGVLLRVTRVVTKPVHLIYNHISGTSDSYLHHCVKIEAGAELTLIETGAAAARWNHVLEVDVAEGGKFHHIRSQGRDRERQAATHIFARIGTGALFKSFTLTANGVMTRNEAVIDMLGDDAVAHIAGAALGDGHSGSFHHDDTVFITHAGLRGESRQVFKKVLKHGATGVFQGKIWVKQGAQKTDGYQISQALLLDEDSQFLAKPELEIYADDVKCSHGSTTGAIDETALFYLRSRGVPQEEAISLLVLSFLADTIAEIEDEALQAEIVDRLEGWLARRR